MVANLVKEKKNWHRFIFSSLLVALMLTLVSGWNAAHAASQGLVTPSSASLGNSFQITGSGFTPNEQIALWTTDPSSKALDAGHIQADGSGNFALRVDTVDAKGLATDGNYTAVYAQTFDDDGNATSTMWQLILKDSPQIGQWYLTAAGITSGFSEISGFSLITPATAQIVATPASGVQGGTFQITGSGFLPNGSVSLWTTAPDGTALDAGRIQADANGNFSLQVNTSDPNGLATAGNYTDLMQQTFDDNGNVTSSLWRVILKDGPAAGLWHLTAQDSVSGAKNIFSFTLNSAS